MVMNIIHRKFRLLLGVMDNTCAAIGLHVSKWANTKYQNHACYVTWILETEVLDARVHSIQNSVWTPSTLIHARPRPWLYMHVIQVQRTCMSVYI